MVSLIMPVYNVKKYLAEAVDSILRQTYTDWELILVDDGSTDGSGAICDGYAAEEERIHVIHQKNKGASGARNAGLEVASGKYVYFPDADDWICRALLEKCVAAMEESGAQIAFFDGIRVTEDGERAEDANVYVHADLDEAVKTGLDWYIEMKGADFFTCGLPFHFYERAFLVESGLKLVEGIMYEDELFSFQAYSKAARVKRINDALYVRRVRSGSVMTSRKTAYNADSMFSVMEIPLNDFLQTPESSKKSALATFLYLHVADMVLRACYAELDADETAARRERYRLVMKTYRRFLRRVGRRKEARNHLMLQVKSRMRGRG